MTKDQNQTGDLLHTQGDLSAVVAELGPEVEIMSSSKKLCQIIAKTLNQVLPPEYGGSGSTVEELTKYWVEEVKPSLFKDFAVDWNC